MLVALKKTVKSQCYETFSFGNLENPDFPQIEKCAKKGFLMVSLGLFVIIDVYGAIKCSFQAFDWLWASFFET